MLARNMVRRVNPVIQISVKTAAARQPVKHDLLFSTLTSPTSSLRANNGFSPLFYSQNVNVENLPPLPVVDFDYVKRATSQNEVMIIDVREPDEIKEHGRIPNSVNIPLGTVGATLSLSEEKFQKTMKRPKPKENTELIFYCMIGKRSGKAQLSAVELGYKNAKNYLGSWTDWAVKTK